METHTVNIQDVATRARVSLGTVSNVLNRPEVVSEVKRSRVEAAIRELGFVRNESARHLGTGQSRTIGFVVMDASNPFFIDVARGAEAAARRAGSFLLTANSQADPTNERAYLGLFEQQRTQGVLIAPIGDVSDSLARLTARGVPAVVVDSPAPSAEYSSVQTDNVAGGRLAMEHLIATQRQRVDFVGGPLSMHQIEDRLTGARQALHVAGLDPAAMRIWEAESSTEQSGRLIGHRIASLPESVRPDAVLATNDLLAMGVLHALMSYSGIRVPEDIAIIGYDDIDWARSAVVPLSSIRQPSELIGSSAAQLLLEESTSPDFVHQQLLLEPELVTRESTAARTAR